MKDTIKTKRITNPLMPEYKLSVIDKRPYTPPKFMRDNIAINDIDGSRPKKQAVYATREFMDNKDIEGAHAKKYKVKLYTNSIVFSQETLNMKILIIQI